MAEKYAKWRDQGTGIQPFLHPHSNEHGNSHRMKVYWVRSGLLNVTAGIIFKAVGWERGWTRTIPVTFGRLILWLFGFYTISDTVVTLKKGVRKPPQGRHYASGDLIVSNHISYIDTIYLWVAYKSPLFVRRVTSEGSQVEVGGLMGALRRDVSSSNKTSGLQTFKSLKEALEWAKTTTSGPLIYFAEETTSNGRGLLTFSSLLEETPHEQVSIHLVGLRYPYTKFSPSFTTGSVWMHLLSLLSQYTNALDVKRLTPLEVSDLLRSTTTTATDNVREVLRSALGQMLRLRLTSLSVVDKESFTDYYRQKETRKKRLSSQRK